MLLPALAKAREKARAISCINNLKQCGLASVMYAQDNNDFIVYYNQAYPTGKLKNVLSYIQSWGDNLVDLDYVASLSKSLYCPAGPVPVWASDSHFFETYGVVVEGAASWCFFKYKTIAIYTANTRGVNAKLLSSPSTAVNHFDSYDSTNKRQMYMVYRPAGLTYRIQARHGDSVNMNFVDGHAEAMRPINMNAMFQANSADYHPGIWYYFDATGTEQNLTY